MNVNINKIFLATMILLVGGIHDSYCNTTEPTAVQTLINVTLADNNATIENGTDLGAFEAHADSTTSNPRATSQASEIQLSRSTSQMPNSIETTPGAVGSTYDVNNIVQAETVSNLDVESTTVADELISVSPQTDVTDRLSTTTSKDQIDSVVTTDARLESSTTQITRAIEISTEANIKYTNHEIPKITATTQEQTTTDSAEEVLKRQGDIIDSRSSIGESHSGDQSSLILITGAVLAFLCFSILLAVGAFYLRRKQKSKQQVMMNFDLNRMDLRSIRHQPASVLIVDFPLKKETDQWEDVKPMNSSVI